MSEEKPKLKQSRKNPIWVVTYKLIIRTASTIVDSRGRPMTVEMEDPYEQEITVHAKDGEEAKALVKQQNPDLKIVGAAPYEGDES